MPENSLGKKNTEDELLPHINIFGITDLDALDLVTGAAERAFGYDVRKNWHYCFKYISLGYIWDKIFKMGVIGFFWNILMSFLIGEQDNVLYEKVFPPQCKHMADEIHQMMNFFRQEINPLEQFYLVYFMFKNITEETADIGDVFTRIIRHDYYDLGKDIADMIIELMDDMQESKDNEDDYTDLEVDGDTLMQD